MLILVIDTRKIYINTDTTPKESKVVYVQLGSSLTQVQLGLTRVGHVAYFNNFNIAYEVKMFNLVIDTRKIYINTDTTPKQLKVVYVQLGSSLTQVEIGLTRVELRLTRVGQVANWPILTLLTRY